MAQMRISHTARTSVRGHIETLILLINRHIRTNWPTETWPTTTRIKFVLRGKEGLTGPRHLHKYRHQTDPSNDWRRLVRYHFFVSPHTLQEITSFDLLIAWLRVAASINNRIRSLIDIDMAVPIRMFL